MAFFMVFVVLAVVSKAEILKASQQPSQNVGINEFENFKNSVLSELRVMMDRESELETELQALKHENEEKMMEINQLKNDMERLNKKHTKCNEASPRQRRASGGMVAFTAYIDHSVHNITHDQAIVYNKVLLNDGDFYNASSGVFTAPFTGVYLFSYSVGAKIIPGVHLKQYDVFTKLMVENDYQLSAVAESTSTYDDEQGSVTAILLIEEGARVWTKHEYKGGNNLFAEMQERLTSFTGTLLYQTEPLGIQGIIG